MATQKVPQTMAATTENDFDDGRTVKLRSKDGDEFELSAKAAKQSALIKTSIECEDDEEEEEDHEECIDIIKVGSSCLEKVVEFLKHHSEEPMDAIETPLSGNTLDEVVKQNWYRNFIGVEQSMVFELVTAANYMEIQPLLDLACLRVSVELMGKTAEEIRVMLNIPKMTAEEEQKARQEHKWIFED